ncbi:uncharacterized protein LOC123192053 [Mangifera indica]|uniref:uncharacterized protein LOC123192053 n=1 Tax=Mangifera indica TaxID=29780 RepID=UPI001CF9C114|nr:uncharacterized protein LOC123192053 [Mangifera indica]
MAAHENATAVEKKVDVVVEEAEPIAAAKVSVICNNEKGLVSYSKDFRTNDNGYFYAQLEGLLSNVNDGMYGAPLRYEKKRLFGKSYEAVIFTAGPLAFRPSNCPTTTQG